VTSRARAGWSHGHLGVRIAHRKFGRSCGTKYLRLSLRSCGLSSGVIEP
jgi:hypothetical protein